MSTFPHGHALVIGIGSYPHSQRHTVPATAADAQAVANIVQDEQFCGYPAAQVTLLSDSSATRNGIIAALDRLAQQTTRDDTVLLFYSGHGDYDTEGNYTLTTHDTRWEGQRVARGTAISQAELLVKLRALNAGRVLLLFNACHAGKLSPTLGDEALSTGQPLPQQTASALLATGSGRIVITACRENQVAFIGPGPRTLFAQALVEGLRGGGEVFNRNGYISAFDLYTHLYYALGDAMSTVPQHLRDHYGSTQEPELTVLKGVGPFAVALYRGASMLGSFPTDHAPARDGAVREVAENRSQLAFENLAVTVNVQSGDYGQNVGINYGDLTQSRQDIHNEAPNQGAQGTFQGPVTFNQGNQYNANRDLIQAGGDVTQVGGDYVGGDKVSGDKIDAQRSQGFVNRPTGPVSQQFGDTVSGDKISGDIHASGISGTGVAIGHKAQAHVQQGGDADAFARAFAAIYEAINSRQPDPNVGKDEITQTVQNIQEEAKKGDQANEKKLTRWLRNLAGMAEDIFDVTVAALSGPQAAFATVARKVAAKAKNGEEQEGE